MEFLLSVGKDNLDEVIIETQGFTETLLYGAKILFIGMAAVFSVLLLIFLCLYVFNLVFHGASKKEQNAPKAEVAPALQATVVTKTAGEDEIVAVIAAAIAAAESECGDTKFRVVSFRRI
jgi:sodium pump decarboxylase gamma subunit